MLPCPSFSPQIFLWRKSQKSNLQVIAPRKPKVRLFHLPSQMLREVYSFGHLEYDRHAGKDLPRCQRWRRVERRRIILMGMTPNRASHSLESATTTFFVVDQLYGFIKKHLTAWKVGKKDISFLWLPIKSDILQAFKWHSSLVLPSALLFHYHELFDERMITWFADFLPFKIRPRERQL